MDKPRINHEKISLRVSLAQKNKLRRLAEINNKSLSQYLLDAGLSLTLDTAKINFYQEINADLLSLKRHLYITSQLILLLANEQYKNIDTVKRYYQAAEEQADKMIKEGLL